jgi:hypothetical protein
VDFKAAIDANFTCDNVLYNMPKVAVIEDEKKFNSLHMTKAPGRLKTGTKKADAKKPKT